MVQTEEIKNDQIQSLYSSQNIIRIPDEQGEESGKKKQSVSILVLFRFAKPLDYFMMVIGVIFAIFNGGSIPFLALLWGNMLDSLTSIDSIVEQCFQNFLKFIYLGLGSLASGWIMITLWSISGQRQAVQCRKQYLKSLLCQQIGWYDVINQSEVSTQFAVDTNAFQSAVGDKIPLVIYIISMIICSMAIAMYKGWLLSLILVGFIIVGMSFMFLFLKNLQGKTKRQDAHYAKAGGRAQQALYSLKTIKGLNGESYESQKYDKCLQEASKGTKRYGFLMGLSLGGMEMMLLWLYAMGFWQGSNCIISNQHCSKSMTTQIYTAGIVYTIMFIFITTGYNSGQFIYYVKTISEGLIAMKRINKIINRKSKIQEPLNGIKLDTLRGIINFNNVSFSYPKQPQKLILNKISFEINKNKTALVGDSGCGKSTILQLLMRFYDPQQGSITIDGHDLASFDLKWLRSIIGYVGQEPSLFSMTIKQNLLMAKPKATNEEIEKSLKDAQVLQFVNQLNEKLQTHLGLAGGQISGGQKQRIGIARAILRNPQIMLLDEATSALDRKKQIAIQNTLNKISENLTSITVAHRINTIKASQQIFVIQKGKIIENGKFQQLRRYEGTKSQHYIDENQSVKLKNSNNSAQTQNRVEALNNKGSSDDIENNKPIQLQKQIKNNQKLTKKQETATFKRMFTYLQGQKTLFLIGILCAFIIGTIYPIFSIFLAEILKLMLTTRSYGDEIRNKCLIIFSLGIISFSCAIALNIISAIIGQKITTTMRSKIFYKLLKMPIYWHQRPQNNINILTNRLSVDSRQVKNLSAVLIFALTQQISTLIIGVVISFVYEWRTALVTLGLLPLLVGSGALRTIVRTGSSLKYQQMYKQSISLLMQSITNIRTVYSLGSESIIFDKFCDKMNQTKNQMTKRALTMGLFHGCGQFFMYMMIGLSFYIGSLFIKNYNVTLQNMFTAVFAIIWASFTIGNNSHIMPDVAEAKKAAANLFQILDEEDEDQLQINQKSKMMKQKIHGNITFNNIRFKYQSRNQYLLDNFNLSISAGQKVALVGPSGCGKSSLLSLLLRFYEPSQGTIQIDGINIKQFDLQYLRSQFGVVSQEPVLFNTSLRENIIYNSKATDQQMIQATKKANAFDFIMRNHNRGEKQDGFEKSVGIKGSHISGGQKQRVAIARQILKNPLILLLDQATSALDSENELIVQQSLDATMEGKTSISIAHRLNTIKNSNIIYVLERGSIIQQGNYKQLMQMKGQFYNLEKGILNIQNI